MEKPLAAGDLAMIIKNHNHEHCVIGSIFTVASIPRYFSNLRCTKCDEVFSTTSMPLAELPLNYFWPIAWLKRIPPLEDLEGLTSEEVLPIKIKEICKK